MPGNGKSGNIYLYVIIVVALIVLGMFLRYDMPPVQLPAEAVIHIGGVTITNTLLATWLAMLLAVLFFRAAVGRMQVIPGRFQALAELVIEAILNLCISVAGDKNGRRFFTLVCSIFIFALFCNWMGLLPGYGTIGFWEETHQVVAAAPVDSAHPAEAPKYHLVPLLRGATTDLNTTLALAIISVVMTQFYGIRSLGVGSYLGKFINFREGPIGFIVGLLELVSEVARLISFSFRLFGNIFAGEVLLAVMSFLVPLVASIPFLGLEVFVGGIQAFIFAMLTLVFITIATTGHGSSENEHPQSASLEVPALSEAASH